jgi:hypothetical protein
VGSSSGESYPDTKRGISKAESTNAKLPNYVIYTGKGYAITELSSRPSYKTAAVFEMSVSPFEGDGSYTARVAENGNSKRKHVN